MCVCLCTCRGFGTVRFAKPEDEQMACNALKLSSLATWICAYRGVGTVRFATSEDVQMACDALSI